MSSGVILLQRPYVSFSSPLLLILRQEITAAAVALLFSSLVIQKNQKASKLYPQHTMHKNIALDVHKKKSIKRFCDVQYYSTANVDKAVTCIHFIKSEKRVYGEITLH